MSSILGLAKNPFMGPDVLIYWPTGLAGDLYFFCYLSVTYNIKNKIMQFYYYLCNFIEIRCRIQALP